MTLLRLNRILRAQIDDPVLFSIRSPFDEQVQPLGPRAAAGQAVRCMDPPVREDRGGERLAELDVADTSLAVSEPALSSAATSQAELPEQTGVSPLEDLAVRDTGVRHMHMDAVRAVPARSRARAACDRLVVPISGEVLASFCVETAALAEGEVVQAALARSAGIKTTEDDVRNTLGRHAVAASHGSLGAGGENGAGRHDDIDRGEAALVERHVFLDEAAEDVDYGGVGD